MLHNIVHIIFYCMILHYIVYCIIIYSAMGQFHKHRCPRSNRPARVLQRMAVGIPEDHLRISKVRAGAVCSCHSLKSAPTKWLDVKIEPRRGRESRQGPGSSWRGQSCQQCRRWTIIEGFLQICRRQCCQQCLVLVVDWDWITPQRK